MNRVDLTFQSLPIEFKLWGALAWLVGLMGGLFRLYEYFAGRSLWLDEASIALNILRRDYLELLTPLQYRQAAPVGWLWTEKLITGLWDSSEFALRFFPLLAGLACLPLLYWIGKELHEGDIHFLLQDKKH